MVIHWGWNSNVTAPSVENIRVADSVTLKVECHSNVIILVNINDGRTEKIQVRKVLYVLELERNLLSPVSKQNN